MKHVAQLFVVASLWLAVGCGGARSAASGAPDSPEPTASTETNASTDDVQPSEAAPALTDRELEASVVMLEGVAAAIEDHAGDCAAMATALNEVIDANETIVVRLKQPRADDDAASRAQELYRSRLQAVGSKWARIGICGADENVWAALARIVVHREAHPGDGEPRELTLDLGDDEGRRTDAEAEAERLEIEAEEAAQDGEN